jgi:hypothetical protein
LEAPADRKRAHHPHATWYRALIPDALPTTLGVPVLVVSDKRLTDMQHQPAPAK